MTDHFPEGDQAAQLPEVPAELWERVLAHAFDPASSVLPDVVPDDLDADISAAWGDDATPDAPAADSAALDADPVGHDPVHPAHDLGDLHDAPWHDAPTPASPADAPDGHVDHHGPDATDDGGVAW
ncbi:hypothetical protein [Mariniluteicoccus flavus]